MSFVFMVESWVTPRRLMAHRFHDWLIAKSFLLLLVFCSPDFLSFHFVLKHYRQLCPVLQLALRWVSITVDYRALVCGCAHVCTWEFDLLK